MKVTTIEEAKAALDNLQWPEWAECLDIGFWEKSTVLWKPIEKYTTVARIERPEPVWVPKVDEPVFVLNGGHLSAGIVVAPLLDKGFMVKVNNAADFYLPHLVKKFDIEKLGKAWEEIE